jgi:hypothetical protein
MPYWEGQSYGVVPPGKLSELLDYVNCSLTVLCLKSNVI